MTFADWLDWGSWVHSVVGGAHFVAAIIALVLGPLIFLNRKGTGAHRLAGYGFVLAMLTVNITALTLYDFTGGPNLFHAFAVLSLTAILPGFYAIRMAALTGEARHLQLHIRLMIWAYFGLLAAGLSQVGTRITFEDPSDKGILFGAIGGITAVSGVVLALSMRRLVPWLANRYTEGPDAPLRTG
ncbi:MAG: DUF2306 domain-containing protein [Alphaproteobacteria bacterium]